MKLLILSFYYRPDLSAGSFRVTALVEALRAQIPPGSRIDVITTQPNRYHSFSAAAPQQEEEAGVRIQRIVLPTHRSGMIDQSKAFATFSREAIKHAAARDYDLVFATSSRLMTAVLGAWIARSQRCKLYLDIRDIFVDTIKDVMSPLVSAAFRPGFALLERWAVGRADKVNLVSRGFTGYFGARYPRQQFSYFTNGIDDEFLSAAPVAPGVMSGDRGRRLTVLYAGNLGEGQGLHAIIPSLAKRMESRLDFRIIGDGGRRQELGLALEKHGVTNVQMLAPMGRDKLLDEYRAADILFLHLNDYEAFKKVLPSKLFEYGALGKPLWAGVSGYAAEFVATEISNAALFHPCDVAGAVKSFEQLDLREAPRTEFIAKHARRQISRQFAQDVLIVAGSRPGSVR